MVRGYILNYLYSISLKTIVLIKSERAKRRLMPLDGAKFAAGANSCNGRMPWLEFAPTITGGHLAMAFGFHSSQVAGANSSHGKLPWLEFAPTITGGHLAMAFGFHSSQVAGANSCNGRMPWLEFAPTIDGMCKLAVITPSSGILWILHGYL
jgi:hypothetical protein